MSKRKPTFLEIKQAARPEMNRNLMARCRRASRIAKLVGGRARRNLYGIKHRGLACLLLKGDATVHVDKWMYPGLLSIRVHGQGSLHSHEGWLEPYIERNYWSRGAEGKAGKDV